MLLENTSLGDLDLSLICQMAAWAWERCLPHPNQCLRQVGELLQLFISQVAAWAGKRSAPSASWESWSRGHKGRRAIPAPHRLQHSGVTSTPRLDNTVELALKVWMWEN